ncbi:MAG: glycosyltransferase [Anaerolinea sp.]|nr:glycosyltransferase [Anaerolinea sp.]
MSTPTNGYRPRILHVLGTPNWAGAQKAVLSFITHQEMHLYDHIVLFILADTGNGLERFIQHGISSKFCLAQFNHLKLLPSYRLNRWVRLRLVSLFPYRLAHLIHRYKISLVHSHVVAYLKEQAQASVTISKRPWIFTAQSLYGLRQTPANLPKRIASIISKSPARLTGVSEAALASWIQQADFPPEKCSVIPNGVEVTKFRTTAEQRKQWRTKHCFPENALIFGSTGRLAPEKGYDVLIDAAAMLLKEGLPIFVVIAGDGPLHQHLNTRIVELGIQNNVYLIGFQENVQALLAGLDVFVLPSFSEGLSLSLLEACVSGLPCIATAVGGTVELLGNGRGKLITPGSPQELAAAMESLMTPLVRRELAANSLNISQSYSIESVAQKYRELYEQLLN